MRIEMPTAELLQQAARMVTTPGVGMTPSQIEAEIAAGRLQPQWSQVAFDGEAASLVGRCGGDETDVPRWRSMCGMPWTATTSRS